MKRYGSTDCNLLAKIFVIHLRVTLQQGIGLKSLAVIGALTFRIREIEVAFHSLSKKPLIKKVETAAEKLGHTTSQFL